MSIVTAIRSQRPGCLTAIDQYLFVYNAILEYAKHYQVKVLAQIKEFEKSK